MDNKKIEGSKLNFIEKTKCEDCPCLNNDMEEGGTCNLKYDTNLFWTKQKDLIYCSHNCELTMVKFFNGVFEPSEKVHVTENHPKNWADLEGVEE